MLPTDIPAMAPAVTTTRSFRHGHFLAFAMSFAFPVAFEAMIFALAFAFRSSGHDVVQQPCAGPLTDLPHDPLGSPLFNLADFLLRKHNSSHGFATSSPSVAA